MATIMSTTSTISEWFPIPPRYLSLAILLFSGTYIFTTLRYKLFSLIGHRAGTPPLTLPYWIPFIGNSLQLRKDAHSFYLSAQRASPDGIIGTRIGPMYSYFITRPHNVQAVFRASKAQTMDPLFLKVFRTFFALPKIDVDILEADTSGHGIIPFPGSNIPEGKRIWKTVHESQTRSLQSTQQLSVLSSIFLNQFLSCVSSLAKDIEKETGGAKELLLFKTFRDTMSTASSHAMLGTNLFTSNKDGNIMADFWRAFPDMLSFFVGMPRFMIPKAWDARERVKRACVVHLERLEERYEEIQKQDADWDPDLGARINRLRDKAYRDMGISIEGRGSMVLGFMMGINGNAVPIAGWIFLELIQSPTLLAAVRSEIETVILANNNKDIFTLDMQKLIQLPLLSSIYTETLRLRMSTTSCRLLRTDLLVGDYLLKAGNWVMLPSHLAQVQSPAWSSTSSSSPKNESGNLHPPDEFWAERFLHKENVELLKTGDYFPFGGGSSMCPGRFFAKQEILIAVAVMVTRFEFEVVGKVGKGERALEEGKLGFEKSGAGAGGLFPDGDLKCVVRRKVV